MGSAGNGDTSPPTLERLLLDLEEILGANRTLEDAQDDGLENPVVTNEDTAVRGPTDRVPSLAQRMMLFADENAATQTRRKFATPLQRSQTVVSVPGAQPPPLFSSTFKPFRAPQRDAPQTRRPASAVAVGPRDSGPTLAKPVQTNRLAASAKHAKDAAAATRNSQSPPNPVEAAIPRQRVPATTMRDDELAPPRVVVLDVASAAPKTAVDQTPILRMQSTALLNEASTATRKERVTSLPMKVSQTLIRGFGPIHLILDSLRHLRGFNAALPFISHLFLQCVIDARPGPDDPVRFLKYYLNVWLPNGRAFPVAVRMLDSVAEVKATMVAAANERYAGDDLFPLVARRTAIRIPGAYTLTDESVVLSTLSYVRTQFLASVVPAFVLIDRRSAEFEAIQRGASEITLLLGRRTRFARYDEDESTLFFQKATRLALKTTEASPRADGEPSAVATPRDAYPVHVGQVSRPANAETGETLVSVHLEALAMRRVVAIGPADTADQIIERLLLLISRRVANKTPRLLKDHYVLKVPGLQEYIYGDHLFHAFDYIRECIDDSVPIDLRLGNASAGFHGTCADPGDVESLRRTIAISEGLATAVVRPSHKSLAIANNSPLTQKSISIWDVAQDFGFALVGVAQVSARALATVARVWGLVAGVWGMTTTAASPDGGGGFGLIAVGGAPSTITAPVLAAAVAAASATSVTPTGGDDDDDAANGVEKESLNPDGGATAATKPAPSTTTTSAEDVPCRTRDFAALWGLALVVQVDLLYGQCRALAEPWFSPLIQPQADPRWHCRVRFPLAVRMLPLEAQLRITLHLVGGVNIPEAPPQTSAGGDRSAEEVAVASDGGPTATRLLAVPVARVCATIFSHNGELKTGPLTLPMWPAGARSGRLSSIETTALNHAKMGPILTLGLDEYVLPVIMPSLSATPAAAAVMAQPASPKVGDRPQLTVAQIAATMTNMFLDSRDSGVPPPRVRGGRRHTGDAPSFSFQMPPTLTTAAMLRNNAVVPLAGMVAPTRPHRASFDDCKTRAPPAAAAARALERALQLDPLSSLTDHERAIIWDHRYHLAGDRRALPKVLESAPPPSPTICAEISRVLAAFAPPDPIDALQLLDARFPSTEVRRYAVERLATLPAEALTRFMPQLVQVLVYEEYHDTALAHLILRLALVTKTAGFRLFWYVRGQIHIPELAERLGALIEAYLQNEPAQRASLVQQHHLVQRLVAISGAAKASGRDQAERTARVRAALAKLSLPPRGLFLPINPRISVNGFRLEQCRVMNSKKAPIWLVFSNSEPHGDIGRNFDPQILFKVGDDLRQDMLTLQVIRLMDDIWRREGYDFCMTPYRCLALGPHSGMIEVIVDAATTAAITRSAGGATAAFREDPIANWLRRHNPSEALYRHAVANFVHSCAGYCVATYVLGVGDRHNDNIMIQKNGRLFHIDYGHFLGNYKKKFGLKRERTPFVFTPDFAYVMGGKDGRDFATFVGLCRTAYNLLRKHANLFINMFLIMVKTGIPELQSKEDVQYLRDALAPRLSDEEAANRFEQLIYDAMATRTTQINNAIHILAN